MGALRCDGIETASGVLEVVYYGTEASMTVALPGLTPGKKACTVTQPSGLNPVSFSILVKAPELAIHDFYPAEACAGQIVTAIITNVAPSTVRLAYESSSAGSSTEVLPGWVE